jgi:hypothetical protein
MIPRGSAQTVRLFRTPDNKCCANLIFFQTIYFVSSFVPLRYNAKATQRNAATVQLVRAAESSMLHQCFEALNRLPTSHAAVLMVHWHLQAARKNDLMRFDVPGGLRWWQRAVCMKCRPYACCGSDDLGILDSGASFDTIGRSARRVCVRTVDPSGDRQGTVCGNTDSLLS